MLYTTMLGTSCALKLAENAAVCLDWDISPYKCIIPVLWSWAASKFLGDFYCWYSYI